MAESHCESRNDEIQNINPVATVQGHPSCNSVRQIGYVPCTPPPSYHNINLPPGHPANLISDRGAPPSYEEVIDRNAPPPSYDSLFGRMREAHKTSKGVFDFLLNIVVLLLGTRSMWVYKEYEPNYDPSLGKYCNKTLYLFAFWLITLVYIFLGVITAGLCCISIATIIFQRRPPDRLVAM
ncbi:hypothetical protein G9C98_000292 [Cotesia typhae]|uniref:Uncharacterized protein n=1 Tax=Cotesia typhae TaxID=2053667 RepID=A0A8J5R1X6_9HYME|nr:hypothetical protein G9C98_000292 [Cotesia typhae]